MPFTGPIEDRLAIREMYGAYADASMRQDRDLYLSLWCEDGERVASDGHLRGKAQVAAHWDGVWGMLKQMGFFAEVSSIEVSGDTATARIHAREIIVLKDDRVWKVIGRYEDRLVREDGAWRFKRRDYTLAHDEGMPGTDQG